MKNEPPLFGTSHRSEDAKPFGDKTLEEAKKQAVSDEGLPMPYQAQKTFVVSPEAAADPKFCQRMADIMGQEVESLGKKYYPKPQTPP